MFFSLVGLLCITFLRRVINMTGWSSSNMTLNFHTETNKTNQKLINCRWRGRGLSNTFLQLLERRASFPHMMSNDFGKDEALPKCFCCNCFYSVFLEGIFACLTFWTLTLLTFVTLGNYPVEFLWPSTTVLINSSFFDTVITPEFYCCYLAEVLTNICCRAAGKADHCSGFMHQKYQQWFIQCPVIW